MTDAHAGHAYLVTPDWLYERLEDPMVRVVDTRSQALFDAGHIPGAVFVDVRWLDVTDTSPAGMRAWIGRLEKAFSAAGITADQEVVFYEEISGEIATRGV